MMAAAKLSQAEVYSEQQRVRPLLRDSQRLATRAILHAGTEVSEANEEGVLKVMGMFDAPPFNWQSADIATSCVHNDSLCAEITNHISRDAVTLYPGGQDDIDKIDPDDLDEAITSRRLEEIAQSKAKR